MVSLSASIAGLYKENNKISLLELKKLFPNANEKTLRQSLSTARTMIGINSKEILKPKIFSKITESEIEKVIIQRLNSSLDNANIRLAIDFLKIKRSDAGLEDDLDIEKYIKKVTDK